MEILIIVILAATSAIFGAATLLLGKEIKNLKGQLWSLEAQSHMEEQEALRALKAAHEKIKRLELTIEAAARGHFVNATIYPDHVLLRRYDGELIRLDVKWKTKQS